MDWYIESELKLLEERREKTLKKLEEAERELESCITRKRWAEQELRQIVEEERRFLEKDNRITEAKLQAVGEVLARMGCAAELNAKFREIYDEPLDLGEAKLSKKR